MRADDWIIIADESIGIGQEKVLVVVVIRRKDVDFTRPLKLKKVNTIIGKVKSKMDRRGYRPTATNCKR